jgi:hypothetical protein
MGDPVTTALVVGTVASTAVSAGAAYQQGQAAEAASEAQARQREIQAENQEIAAAQEEAQRRQELTDTLETIQSIRASRGLQQDSPTGQAITRTNIRRGERDIQIGRFNRRQGASRARMAADAARQRGSAAATGGMLRAGSSLLSGATRGLTLAQSPPSSGGAGQGLSSTGGAGGGMGQPLPR